MTIKELQQNTYSQNIIDTAEVDSILSLALHKNLEYIYKNPDKKISLGTRKKFAKLIALRLQHWPLAYLRKNKDFFGLNFIVNRHTLIPRPDSELLVEEAIKYLNNSALRAELKSPKILDMGTGSGCLIISLAKNTQGQFFASDLKKSALKIAKLNARKNKVKINFILSNLFTKIPEQNFDLILANLPYLAQKQMSEPSIKKEPRSALVSGLDGLEHYRKFFRQVTKYLNKKFCILLEMDPSQAIDLKNLSQQYFPQSKIEILSDLNQRNRLIKIEQK